MSTAAIEERVDELLARMTLEEKVGLMFHAPIFMNPDGTLLDDTEERIAGRHLNHFNIYFAPGPRQHAEWHNRLQDLAKTTRLGIPVTISSDPRHSIAENFAAAWSATGFSQWPEPIGFGALGDVDAVREFGDIARREYRAVGIHVALHPMADLATEPRWARIMHTFGEDGELAARLVAAYIRGFQGEELGPQSVACMTKHFPGGGPQLDGEDPHFAYGKDQVYPGGMFEYHMRVFEAAFEAGTAQIMPYYGRPVGTPLEEVGFGFNRDVVTGLLRERYGFDGVVCTDWGLVTDAPLPDGSVFAAKCWGVEELERRGAARQDRRGGLRPARRRGAAGGARRARARGAHRRGANRRVGAPPPAGQVPPRALRRSLCRSRRSRAHVRLAPVPGRGRACAAALGGRDLERRRAAAEEGVRVYADGLVYEGAAESPGRGGRRDRAAERAVRAAHERDDRVALPRG